VNVTVVVDEDLVFCDSAPLGSCHRFEELDDSIFKRQFFCDCPEDGGIEFV
jgi:hypothetical protein